MNIEIACLRCNGLFLMILGEAEQFIKNRACQKFLERTPFPKRMQRFFSSRKSYIKHLIEYHCPYCREVVFGMPFEPNRYRKPISEDKYLKITEEEIRNRGGFQFYKTEEHQDGTVIKHEDGRKIFEPNLRKT